jgi:hypothetical protein
LIEGVEDLLRPGPLLRELFPCRLVPIFFIELVVLEDVHVIVFSFHLNIHIVILVVWDGALRWKVIFDPRLRPGLQPARRGPISG